MTARTKDSPSSSTFGHFYCERAVITDVNRRTWTCRAESIYSAKRWDDLQWMAPYQHPAAGEGFHFMPEVGAHCYVASPVDDSPPIVLGFITPPAVEEATGSEPLRHNETPGGSNTDVSYQGKRPDLNPGDLAMTTRDGNFLILRRGGILQLGATPMAQRICVPVRNFMRDFAENYELVTVGGDVSWLVDRPELDPAGKAACSYTFHLQEFATDKLATVRVRHLPPAEGGEKKVAWDVVVAPQKISRDGSEPSGKVYAFRVLTNGTVTEITAGNRTTEIGGDDALTVKGDHTVEIQGELLYTAKDATIKARSKAAIIGKAVSVGDAHATEPALLGNAMTQWLQTATVLTAMGPALFSPQAIADFQKVLSRVVTVK